MNRPGHTVLTLACCLLLAAPAWTEEVVRRIDWQEVATANGLTSGSVIASSEGAQGPSLRVVHQGTSSATLPLIAIERPAIRTARYALRGRVKYEGVATGSYLEMWNYLSDGAFFSRTLDQHGPMRRLEGTSEWRVFVLPFFNRAGSSPPEKLVLNLVLTGAGTVEIAPLELVQFADTENPLADSNAWWNPRQAAILGAVGGAALGLLGALVGWLGSAGRARGFVLNTLKAIGWLGVGALLLGGSAWLGGQPYEVYYPLLLVGAISAALGFSLPRSLSRRYEDLELRRMQALDA